MHSNNTIRISKKNYTHYSKIKNVMEQLVILDKLSIRTSYDNFAKSANDIIKEVNIDKLSFKDFIADVKDTNDTIDIDYQEYEELISAKTAYQAILNFDIKSKKKMDWSQYGIGIDSIIEAYKK